MVKVKSRLGTRFRDCGERSEAYELAAIRLALWVDACNRMPERWRAPKETMKRAAWKAYWCKLKAVWVFNGTDEDQVWNGGVRLNK